MGPQHYEPTDSLIHRLSEGGGYGTSSLDARALETSIARTIAETGVATAAR